MATVKRQPTRWMMMQIFMIDRFSDMVTVHAPGIEVDVTALPECGYYSIEDAMDDGWEPFGTYTYSVPGDHATKKRTRSLVVVHQFKKALPPGWDCTDRIPDDAVNPPRDPRRRPGCQECGGGDDPMFFVTDELWNQHRGGYDRLCMDCFRKRLGRDLRLEDLLPTPLNDVWREAIREHGKA